MKVHFLSDKELKSQTNLIEDYLNVVRVKTSGSELWPNAASDDSKVVLLCCHLAKTSLKLKKNGLSIYLDFLNESMRDQETSQETKTLNDLYDFYCKTTKCTNPRMDDEKRFYGYCGDCFRLRFSNTLKQEQGQELSGSGSNNTANSRLSLRERKNDNYVNTRQDEEQSMRRRASISSNNSSSSSSSNTKPSPPRIAPPNNTAQITKIQANPTLTTDDKPIPTAPLSSLTPSYPTSSMMNLCKTAYCKEIVQSHGDSTPYCAQCIAKLKATQLDHERNQAKRTPLTTTTTVVELPIRHEISAYNNNSPTTTQPQPHMRRSNYFNSPTFAGTKQKCIYCSKLYLSTTRKSNGPDDSHLCETCQSRFNLRQSSYFYKNSFN
jgi:hypothetical protein